MLITVLAIAIFALSCYVVLRNAPMVASDTAQTLRAMLTRQSDGHWMRRVALTALYLLLFGLFVIQVLR